MKSRHPLLRANCHPLSATIPWRMVEAQPRQSRSLSPSCSPQLVTGLAQKQVELLQAWATNIGLKTIMVDAVDPRDGGTDQFGLNNINFNNHEFQNFVRRVKAKGICMSGGLDELAWFIERKDITLPVFLPLIGLDKNQIDKYADHIKI